MAEQQEAPEVREATEVKSQPLTLEQELGRVFDSRGLDLKQIVVEPDGNGFVYKITTGTSQPLHEESWIKTWLAELGPKWVRAVQEQAKQWRANPDATLSSVNRTVAGEFIDGITIIRLPNGRPFGLVVKRVRAPKASTWQPVALHPEVIEHIEKMEFADPGGSKWSRNKRQ